MDPVKTEDRDSGQTIDVVTVPHGSAVAHIDCIIGPSKPAFKTIKW